jgi:hypothetical protein
MAPAATPPAARLVNYLNLDAGRTASSATPAASTCSCCVAVLVDVMIMNWWCGGYLVLDAGRMVP